MKKLAKVLTLLLALALILGTLVLVISADGGNVAKIGDKEYATLVEAFAEVPAEGANIVLIGNATVDAEIAVNANVTLDLNGYTLTSTATTAFVADSGVTFNVVGTGKIVSNGAIFASATTTAEPVFNLIGSAGTTGIDVDFLASLGGTLVSIAQGDATVRNVDIVVVDYSAVTRNLNLFDAAVTATASEGGLVYSAKGVDWVLDAVTIVTPAVAPGSGDYYVIDAVNMGTIMMRNCAIHSSMNVIRTGLAKGESVDSRVVTIENSVLYVDGYNPTFRPQLICGMPEDLDENAYGMTGTIYVKDSYLASRVRVLVGCKGGLGTSKVILDNSEIVCNGNLGKDNAHQLVRGFALDLTNGSKLGSTVSAGIHAWDSTTFGAVTLELGSRCSKVSTLDSSKITIPEGATWLYDPAGNAAYPYVLANGAVEGALPTPDYVIFSNIEDVRAKTNNKWGENTVEIDRNIVAVDNASEDMNTATWKGVQWDIKKGTASIVTAPDGNRYVEYLLNVKQDSDPYFIPAGGYNNTFPESNFFISGDNRRKVIVASTDFATTPEAGYPDFNFAPMARQNGSNMQGKQKGISFKKNGSEIINDLYDAKDVHLNPAGQWNNVTMVFYSDPGYLNDFGICYVYINGEYVGNSPFHKVTETANLYVEGIRFNINKQNANNGILALDNMTLLGYNEYAGATECDSSAVGTKDGVHTPDIYVAKYNEPRYFTSHISVSGIAYNDINEAFNDATATGTVVELTGDVTEPVTVNTDGVLYTNGYTINISDDSYAAKVVSNADGDIVSYEFKKAYNDYVLYCFWLVVGGDPNDYDNLDAQYVYTTVKVGQIPTAPHSHPDIVDLTNYTVSRQIGWDRDGSGNVYEFVPVLLEEAGTETDFKMSLFHPVYKTYPMTSYVKDASGVVSYQISDEESFRAYQNLKDGQTLVLLSDITITANTTFDNPDPQYAGGVEIDNEYTAEEIATMKAASVKIAVDLNGYKMINNINGYNIARVGRNTTLTVYSSKPGAEIYSAFVQYDSSKGTYYTNGQRMFTIFNGNESFDGHDAVYNGHIVLGTYGDIPGSNLTLKGGVILEGLTGDNSTSIAADGMLMIVVAPTSGGALMTRYYSGEMIVTNCTLLVPTKDNIIDMKAYYYYDGKDQSKYFDKNDETAGRKNNDTRIATAYMYLENCVLINNNGTSSAIVGNCGDGIGVRLVMKNVQTNGRLNPSNNGDVRVRIYEGVASTNFALSGGLLADAENTAIVNYNLPLNMNAWGTNHVTEDVYKIDYPTLPDNKSNQIEWVEYYIVNAGAEASAPTAETLGENDRVYQLGNLNKGTALKSNTVTVTFAGLTAEAEPTEVVQYIKGGNYVATTKIPADVSLGATKLTFAGAWNEAPAVITEDVVVTPMAEVASNINGVLANLSIYSDFNVNLFVPIEYKAAITSIKVGGVALTTVDVDMNGDGTADYVKVTYKVACDNATADVVFTISINDGENTATCTATVNVASYAETILAGEYTAEDKQLMYYMAAYANEAYKYFAASETDNATLAALLTTYADAKGEYVASGEYAEAIADTKLGDAFASATVDLGSAPRFVLTLKDGFAGTVTVTYGPNTYTKTVTATDSRVLVIDGMKAYNFIVTLDVTAEGTIGETAVSVAGNYNLDTFVKYHVENAASESETAAESQKCLALLKAFYDYVVIANAYKA